MKVLPQLGCDVALLPTTMLGRHPGWGAPGGGAVSDDLFQGMSEGLAANDIPARCDGVITGYFASRDQVNRAADLIERDIKGRVPVIVDPVIGDDGKGLYVKQEVAVSIADRLLPLADVITPNAFELGWLKARVGKEWFGVFDAYETSARERGLIGIRGPSGAFAGREPIDDLIVPNGVGDLATLLIARSRISGETMMLEEVVACVGRQIERSENGEICALI